MRPAECAQGKRCRDENRAGASRGYSPAPGPWGVKTGGRLGEGHCYRCLLGERVRVLDGLGVLRVIPDGEGTRSAHRCSNPDVGLVRARSVLA